MVPVSLKPSSVFPVTDIQLLEVSSCFPLRYCLYFIIYIVQKRKLRVTKVNLFPFGYVANRMSTLCEPNTPFDEFFSKFLFQCGPSTELSTPGVVSAAQSKE